MSGQYVLRITLDIDVWPLNYFLISDLDLLLLQMRCSVDLSLVLEREFIFLRIKKSFQRFWIKNHIGTVYITCTCIYMYQEYILNVIAWKCVYDWTKTLILIIFKTTQINIVAMTLLQKDSLHVNCILK